MFANRQFRFSPLVAIHAVLIAALCYYMSYWQARRYLEKKVYVAALVEQAQHGVQEFNPNIEHGAAHYFAEVEVEGYFDHEQSMVLKSRSNRDEIPGVKLITPLKLEGFDQVILVDRGFIVYNDYFKIGDRSPYQPKTLQIVKGTLQPSQKKEFFLSPNEKRPKPGKFKEKWHRLEIPLMAIQLPYPVSSVYLEQTNQSGGYLSFDSKKVLSPGRHLNYVFQWLGFGTFALFIGALFMLKRVDGMGSTKA